MDGSSVLVARASLRPCVRASVRPCVRASGASVRPCPKRGCDAAIALQPRLRRNAASRTRLRRKAGHPPEAPAKEIGHQNRLESIKVGHVKECKNIIKPA